MAHSYSKLALIAAVALLSACSNQKEVSYKSGGMTQTFAEGKDSVPKDLSNLIFDKATPTGSVSGQDSKEESKFVMLSTSAPTEEVSQWYQDTLKKQGWEIENIQEQEKVVSIAGKKKDMDVNVMITEDDGKTTISLSESKSGEGQQPEEQPDENYTPDKVTPPTD